jgi:hypothetical protein
MARLPVQGSDSGIWGTVLNDFLSQAHSSDGTLKAGSVGTSAIADDAVTDDKVSNPYGIMPDGGRRIWTRTTPPGPADGVQEGDIWAGPET